MPAATTGCLPWEYKDSPRWEDILEDAVAALLESARRDPSLRERHAEDTRAAHKRMFRQLTPNSLGYYAGHYRGEDYLCLRDYRVGTPSDPMVGYPPDRVPDEMKRFSGRVLWALRVLESAREDPRLTKRQRLLYLVMIACRLHVEFLTIHPYANGNGHAGRYLLWILMGHFDVWVGGDFAVHPRPALPYEFLLSPYRRGKPFDLEAYVLKCCLA